MRVNIDEVKNVEIEMWRKEQGLPPKPCVVKVQSPISSDFVRIYIDGKSYEFVSDDCDERREDESEPYYIDGRGIYIPIINKVLAMKDAFDGEEVVWKQAIEAGAPTKDEWYIILFFKEEIQRLLKENGGQPLENDYYWSSTEFDSGLAWYVYFYNGGVRYHTKYHGLKVRPISAL